MSNILDNLTYRYQCGLDRSIFVMRNEKWRHPMEWLAAEDARETEKGPEFATDIIAEYWLEVGQIPIDTRAFSM